MAISDALDALIAADKPVQLRLKGDPSGQPIGPGKVVKTQHDLPGRHVTYTYTMVAPAKINTPNGPRDIFLPMTFAGEDVMCIFGEPVDAAGEPISMVTPGAPAKRGIQIGGS